MDHAKVLMLTLAMGCAKALPSLNTATSSTLVMPAPGVDARREHIPGRSLLIEDATLIDGLGGPPKVGVDVWVEDGSIHQIGVDLQAPGLPRIDAEGLILLPGMITAHSHVQSVPGSVLRRDSPAAIQVQQELQLRAYLASGFTTVLDPAIGLQTALRLQAYLEAGNPGPELFVLAPFVTPADGYMTSAEMRGNAFADFWPAVVDAQTELEPLLEQAEVLNPVGAKVALEDGVVFSNLATFDEDTLEQIASIGQQNNVRLFVHSISNDDHRQALELNPHGLVHVGMWDEELATDVVDELARRGTYVMTTITLNHLALWGWSRSFEDDDWIRARVPVLQWDTATHPDEPRALGMLAAEIMRPGWVPARLAQLSASMFVPSEEDVAEITASGVAAVQALEDAGIPWVVGADEGNSPAYTTYFHGVASQIELEQLDAGGIPRESILRACTQRPAEMLGAADRLGTIEVGKQADMILVADNPFEHGMVAMRTLQWTIKRGEARTPSSWLVDP